MADSFTLCTYKQAPHNLLLLQFYMIRYDYYSVAHLFSVCDNTAKSYPKYPSVYNIGH